MSHGVIVRFGFWTLRRWSVELGWAGVGVEPGGVLRRGDSSGFSMNGAESAESGGWFPGVESAERGAREGRGDGSES